MFQFKQVAGMIATHALMLLGAATAWAGRGDVDPNYGKGGALAIGADVLIGLPNDRLAIIGGGSVSVADSNGRAVSSFGDDGQAVVPTPADNTLGFQAWGAAPGTDGRLLVYGILSDAGATRVYEAMFLLDAPCHADSVFGGNDDGFFRVTGESIALENSLAPATLVAFALDPAGPLMAAPSTGLKGAATDVIGVSRASMGATDLLATISTGRSTRVHPARVSSSTPLPSVARSR